MPTKRTKKKKKTGGKRRNSGISSKGRSRETSREIRYYATGAAVETESMSHETIMKLNDDDLYVPQGEAGLEDPETIPWYKLPDNIKQETYNNMKALQKRLEDTTSCRPRTYKLNTEKVSDNKGYTEEQRLRDAEYVQETRYLKHSHNIEDPNDHDAIPRTPEAEEVIMNCGNATHRLKLLTQAQYDTISSLDAFSSFESSMQRITRIKSTSQTLGQFTAMLKTRCYMDDFQRQAMKIRVSREEKHHHSGGFVKNEKKLNSSRALHIACVYKLHDFSRYFSCVIVRVKRPRNSSHNSSDSFLVQKIHGWFYYACGCKPLSK